MGGSLLFDWAQIQIAINKNLLTGEGAIAKSDIDVSRRTDWRNVNIHRQLIWYAIRAINFAALIPRPAA
jgi:hypothetical protein